MANPFGAKGAMHMEEPRMETKPAVGHAIEFWTPATDDTRLVIGATEEGKLVVHKLSNPAGGGRGTDTLTLPV